ncbi:hypothetical protein CCICO_09140 [Corynebacterium ciconiae DSM 44920]|uniref:hypothetical protein n=1 Tax=Corynebacterium ciconiae TaxID=227319 RepID=UPI00035D24B0|nr:hypothetical protein [Corynebacterium ciconiae]WKD61836.1 hypothetical protein CCICO_09140 [Corynebacterium ciconiae DSM 44920]
MNTYTDILPWLILAFIVGDLSVSSWFLYSKNLRGKHLTTVARPQLRPGRAAVRGLIALFNVAFAVFVLRGSLIPWNSVIPVELWWAVCILIFLYSFLTTLVIVTSMKKTGIPRQESASPDRS